MTQSDPTLTSVPEDILLEVLSLLLVDTPRSPTRAAILRTCSLLHELGLPLLHRVVDLQAYTTAFETVAHWTALFGVKGSLTREGRVAELGASVVELRLGSRRVRRKQGRLWIAQANFVFGSVHLPRCTRLVYDGTHLRSFPRAPFAQFLFSLPITHLTFSHPVSKELVADRYDWSEARRMALPGGVYLTAGEQRWKDLHTIHFNGRLWFDSGTKEHDAEQFRPFAERRISFWQWSLKTLVVDLPRDLKHPAFGTGREFIDLFFEPNEGRETVSSSNMAKLGPERWWNGLERIELRVPTWLEDEFRLRHQRAQKKSLATLQQKILPMIVFVGVDGEERKLMAEGEEEE